MPRILIIPTMPKYAEAERKGLKTSELRLRIPKGLMPGDKAVLYETAPVSKITTEFTVMACGFSTAETEADVRRIASRGFVKPSQVPRYESVAKLPGRFITEARKVGEIMIQPGTVRKLEEPRPVSDYGLTWAPQTCTWARKDPERN